MTDESHEFVRPDSDNISLADDQQWWDKRSALDPLAAVLDPADEHGRRNAHMHGIHSAALRRFARFGREDHVLDFGCGNGRLSRVIAPRVGRVTGVDISSEMIGSAKQLSAGMSCDYLAFDGERLPFPADAFDGAVTGVVLQMYYDQPDRFRLIVTELARTLRPGAAIWMIERAVPRDGENGWSLGRWEDELSECGIRLVGSHPVRSGATTRTGKFVVSERFPRPLMGIAARVDLALARRRGIAEPYTEVLIHATRL